MSPIKKDVTIGDCRLILGDCLSVMPLLGKVDCVVTDPPYEIDAGKMNLGGARASRISNKDWDMVAPDMSWVTGIEKAIVWGGNYFGLPSHRCFLIYDKGAGMRGRSFAECEMAWTNLDSVARVFTFSPNNDLTTKYHKTQKPVPLMEWCLGFVRDAETILDPFMGSGTTLVACAKLGRKGIGIELDEEYFEIACARVQAAYDQPDLFVSQPEPQPTQGELL